MKTARDRLSVHSQCPICAGCHALTDPIGLALENFDGAGQFRVNDQRHVRIDPTGSLDKVPTSDAAGLGKHAASNPSVRSCMLTSFMDTASDAQ